MDVLGGGCYKRVYCERGGVMRGCGMIRRCGVKMMSSLEISSVPGSI